MHYTRFKRHGSPHVRLKNNHPEPTEKLLATRVPDRPAGQCWLWRGSKDGKGYGQINRQGRVMRAHRFVYEYFRGPIDPDLVLLHACDNGMCVNPEHLTPGTHSENHADMVRKGRNSRGEKHRAAKLTELQVMEARRKYATGNYAQTQLAREYGLTQVPMRQLLLGITWKHLPLVEGKAS